MNQNCFWGKKAAANYFGADAKKLVLRKLESCECFSVLEPQVAHPCSELLCHLHGFVLTQLNPPPHKVIGRRGEGD